LPVIVNISAGSPKEFGELAEYLTKHDRYNLISGLEINVSCPNIREGGKAFGASPSLVKKIVAAVKRKANGRFLITKLTPNVTDIIGPATAAIKGGTDAISMINTLRGMAINTQTGEPLLGNITGGLSGPAIKPVGVFFVHQCFKNIEECYNKTVPIVGIGGITNANDALEYIMAGASAVGIGTHFFVNTRVFEETKKGIERFLIAKDKTLSDIIGITAKGEYL